MRPDLGLSFANPQLLSMHQVCFVPCALLSRVWYSFTRHLPIPCSNCRRYFRRRSFLWRTFLTCSRIGCSFSKCSVSGCSFPGCSFPGCCFPGRPSLTAPVPHTACFAVCLMCTSSGVPTTSASGHPAPAPALLPVPLFPLPLFLYPCFRCTLPHLALS